MPPGFLFWLALISLAALVSVVVTLDPAGDAPFLAQGPGITLDEPLNVRPGLYHWRLLWDHGIGFWDPANTNKFFGDPDYLADYPPWGRIWIGFWHDMTLPFLGPARHPGPDVLLCARVGSAVAFALTVFLCGIAAHRWFGGCAGTISALAVALMPRLWAHAHIASIETVLNLAYVLIVLVVGMFWTRRDAEQRGVRLRWATLGGILWGLALLTKIQAVFVPFPLILWTLWIWRWRAIVPLAVFGVTGLTVFYAGWPWLWLNPSKNCIEYFARSTERITLDCFYWGREWVDRDVPWHYPWVMFAVVVPLGWHLLATIGMWPTIESVKRTLRLGSRPAEVLESAVSRVDPMSQRLWLLGLNILFPLIVFSIPGVPVYDGERLFLMVFPFWGIATGAGAESLRRDLADVKKWSSLRTSVLISGIVLAQTWGLIMMHPCQLNFYNLLTGGLRGAAPLGFETCYWGDSVCREFLVDVSAAVPPGSTIDVAPVMHNLQLEELLAQSPILRDREIKLRAFDDRFIDEVRYALVFRRRADPWATLEHPPEGARLVAELKREGVQLAALYEFLP